MTIFRDWEDVIHIDYCPPGYTVNAKYNSSLLYIMHSFFWSKSSGKVSRFLCFCNTMQEFAQRKWPTSRRWSGNTFPILQIPVTSASLVQWLNHSIRFKDEKEIKRVLKVAIGGFPQERFGEGTWEVNRRWKRCIDIEWLHRKVGVLMIVIMPINICLWRL